MPANKTALHLHSNLYTAKIKGNFFLAFNPYSFNKPVVFPNRFYPLYQRISGKTGTLQDYFDTASQLKYSPAEAKEFLRMLTDYDLATTGNKKNTLRQNPNDSRHWRFTVWLHLTNDCNFRCKYCFVDKNPDKITFADLHKSVDRIVASSITHKIKRITFVLGGGEPLLQYELIKQLNDYCEIVSKKNAVSIRLAIITNGSLLTDERALYFKEKKTIVGISVDGAEKYHNQTRVFRDGSGTFQQVKRGLEIANKHGILANVSITATAENIKGLPEFISYILHINPKIKIMLGLVKNIGLSSSHKKRYDDVIIRELKKTYRLIRDFYARVDLDFSYLNYHKLLDSIFLNDPNNLYCGAGSNYLTVTHKGKLKLCPSLLDDFALDVREGDDVIDLAKKNNFLYPEQMRVDDIAKCNQCPWKYMCRGGCPSEKFNMGVSIKSKPADYCRVYKTIIPYQIKLEGERLASSMLEKIKNDEK